jgi:hypothetical protein
MGLMNIVRCFAAFLGVAGYSSYRGKRIEKWRRGRKFFIIEKTGFVRL